MKNRFLYTYILIFFPLICFASGQSYTFRGVTMADGLSDLLVNVIYKDSEGFIWLGTDNSLDRFDGVSIRHFPFEGAEVKKKRVNVITEDAARNLWIGNPMGLWRLEQGRIGLQRMYPETLDSPVFSLYVMGETLYIGTAKGLFSLKDDELKQTYPDQNLLSPTNRIKGMTADESGSLWLATAAGLCCYNPADDSFQQYHPASGLEGENAFRHITRIGQTLYLGTENQGIFSFDVPTARFSRFVDVGSQIISSLSSDGEDRIYVGTDGYGVHFLSHREKKITHSFLSNINDRTTIRSNSVYSLLVDKEGIVWIGYYQAGFDYSLYQNDLFHTYTVPSVFDSKNRTVRSFFIHGQEKLIGTRDGLYYINEETKSQKVFRMPELRSNLIFSIHYYRGKFYIGTYGGGLSIVDAQTLRVSPFEGSDDITFRNGHIFCLKQDAQDNLWIGTSNGVYCYNGYTDSMRHYNHTSSQMPEGNTYDIFFDSTGKGWICTDNGLSIYDPSTQSMRSNIFPEGFFHREKIRTVFEDSRKKLYFLPDRGGLLTSDLSMRQYETIPIHPILHGNAYTTILEDDEGWIWLGSDDGMIRQKEGEKKYYTFNFTDGIPDPTFMYPSYKDDQGILWFSNNKGLLSVDPSQVDRVKRDPYKIVMTEIRLKGVALSEEMLQEARRNDLLRLRKEENNIGFSFVNLSYTDPVTTVYSYKLEGKDDDWSLLTGGNAVNYYDLRPGKYSFRVRIPGNEYSERVIHLEVGSWLTANGKWLAGIVCFLIALGLSGGYYFKRRKTSVAKEKEMDTDLTEEIHTEESPVEQEKYKMNKLNEKECKALHKKLKAYMEAERPYRNPDLKIADLARALESSSTSLSYLFNQYLNQSYYDFINHYRIEAFKVLVNDPQYTRYTLTAMASLCGFSSRASFFRSFKKATGITPNEYIHSLGREPEEAES
ncbi:two-component regulator propeller domain-containing protein [Parabacteroides sp. PF5-6]|uniref:two-component regulator propeller domain-containing protein n=1 Tax=Parabacteroides sp. PF5-6 TaxID=1742403 RepID=UPI00240730BB|nr:two-component regulator propeller domain-containing protein [Parabacteroides sp. PF5-6]MDF9829791.1 ligand-binding sensor domain-containing protein/AraC-like DNA-binding protein [Parabacteroides sp. PF5-6]